jgi:hypothetical protein
MQVWNCFVFPSQSFALKELGVYLQYPVKFPDFNGMVVAFKYLKLAEDCQLLERVLKEYNEDDVRVLPFIISILNSNKLPIFLVKSSLIRGISDRGSHSGFRIIINLSSTETFQLKKLGVGKKLKYPSLYSAHWNKRDAYFLSALA